LDSEFFKAVKNQREILDKTNDEEFLAERFEFTFNNNYYVKNLEIDPEGRFIRGKYNKLQGRVISKIPIEIKYP
jgi:hypothetical protein